jgi:hypothetical protein
MGERLGQLGPVGAQATHAVFKNVPRIDPGLEQGVNLQFRVLVRGLHVGIADPHRAKIPSRHVLTRTVLATVFDKPISQRFRRSAQYDTPLVTKGRFRTGRLYTRNRADQRKSGNPLTVHRMEDRTLGREAPPRV